VGRIILKGVLDNGDSAGGENCHEKAMDLNAALCIVHTMSAKDRESENPIDRKGLGVGHQKGLYNVIMSGE
jgi:hypothetical protein